MYKIKQRPSQGQHAKPKRLGSMAGVNSASSKWRALYNSLEPMENVVTTMSFLRLESQLGNSNTITFNALVNQGTTIVTEKRLDQPNVFVVGDFILFIRKHVNTEPQSVSVLDTFPNPTVYTAANEARNLQAMYNGYLQLRVNQTVYIDSIDTLRYKRVGVAQRGLAVSTAGANNTYGDSELDNGDYASYDQVPGVVLSGADNIQFQITLPEAVDLSAPAGQTNYAVLIARGFLRQNAAKFNPKSGRWQH
jgi:hypothetical protein